MFLEVFGFDAKMKKNKYGMKKGYLVLDGRFRDRIDLKKKLEGLISVNHEDLPIAWWSYTNGMIVYSNLYCSRYNFENYIKPIIESTEF